MNSREVFVSHSFHISQPQQARFVVTTVILQCFEQHCQVDGCQFKRLRKRKTFFSNQKLSPCSPLQCGVPYIPRHPATNQQAQDQLHCCWRGAGMVWFDIGSPQNPSAPKGGWSWDRMGFPAIFASAVAMAARYVPGNAIYAQFCNIEHRESWADQSQPGHWERGGEGFVKQLWSAKHLSAE